MPDQFGQFGQTQFPFLHQAPYFPAQMGGQGGAMGDMSHILSMFAGPMLGNLAGPNNFVPSMLPAQSLDDQFAMKQFTSQTNMARFSAMRDQNPNVANTLLGARSMVTNAPASELNREQAMQGAQVLNHPLFQMFAGQMMGPENLEMMLHGSEGNPQALAQATNRMGFFRRDPMGGQRMNADSLASFSRGVYSELYRPDGDIEKMTESARQGGADSATSIQALKQAAGQQDRDVISDTDIAQRLVDERGDEEVGKLYEKYVAGGKATDAATQAQELTKFHRAISSSGVLKDNETSIAGLAAAAERKPLDEMHGFSAGQAAQMQEELLRRGMLPEAIGHMSQNERLRTIDNEMSQMGEGRLNDMARDLAHQSLMNDKTEVGARYRQKTEVEQRAQVEQELPHFRQQLDQDRKKLSAFAAGKNDPDTGQPISPEELDKLGSMGAMSSTADASRVGQSVKEFAGAVDAVREIFGDNGNPNAPMPALMAALNGLTQGKIANMNAGAVQATLRKMQQAARETGIGFEQMAAMSAQMGAQGQLLGLSQTTTMSNQASAMSALKVMQDSGATTSQAAGALSRDELLAKEGQLLQAGAGSDNAKSMAALAAMYEADPQKFAGTKLEKMAQAYREGPDGTGDYEFDGETFNLYEEVGRTRGFVAHDAVLAAEQQSGAGLADFQAIKLDPAVEEYVRKNASAGRRTQRFETLQEFTEQLGAGYVADTGVDADAAYQNLGSDTQRAVQRELMSTIVDSAQLPYEERNDAVREKLPDRLQQVLQQSGMDAAEAAQKAQEIAGKLTDNNLKLTALTGRAGQISKGRTGDTLAAQSQLNSTEQAAGALEQNRVDNAQAQRRTESPIAKTNPLGGFVSYLQNIGKNGENFNIGDAAAAAFNVRPDSEMHQRMLKDIQPMMQELSTMRDEAFYTSQDAKKFAADARSADVPTRDKAVEELKKMGAVAADATVLTDPAEEKAATDRVIKDMSPDEIRKIHDGLNLSPLKRADGDTRADHELMLERVRDTDTFKAAVAKKLQKENTYTVDSLTDAAKTGIGTVKDDAAADRYQMGVKSFENEDTARVFFKDEMARANISDDTQAKLSESLFGAQTADSEANFEAALQGLDPEVAERMKAIAGGVRFSRTLPEGSQIVRSATESDRLTPETAAQQEERRKTESQSAVQKQEGGEQSFFGGMLSNLFGYGANQTPTVSTSAATAGAAQKGDAPIKSANVAVTGDKVEVKGEVNADVKVSVSTSTDGSTPAASAAPDTAKDPAKEPATAPAPQATQVPSTAGPAPTPDKPLTTQPTAPTDAAATASPAAEQPPSKPADPIRDKYEAGIARSQRRLEAGRKNPDSEIRADLERVNTNDLQAQQRQLRAYEVAKESGIPWNAATGSGKLDEWKTRGDGVPVSINGQDVDPAALTEDEIKSVIGAIEVSAMMDRGDMSPADATQLEKYKTALAEKQKAASTTAAPPAAGEPAPAPAPEAATAAPDRPLPPPESKTAEKKEERRYTADEWAELHRGEYEEDAFGGKQPLTPISQNLPDGDYERVNGGNYVNTKTGEQFDRYGNPAGGTYSADGRSWSNDAWMQYFDGVDTRTGGAITEKPTDAPHQQPEAATAAPPADTPQYQRDKPLPPLDETLEPETSPALSSANVSADAGDFMSQTFTPAGGPMIPGQKPSFQGPSPFSAPAAMAPVSPRYLGLPQIEIPPAKSRLPSPETLDDPLATLPTSVALQNETRHLDTAANVRPAAASAQQNTPSGGASDKNLNVIGKLEISGLHEAILNASGSQPYTPAGDGPAIMGAETGFA